MCGRTVLANSPEELNRLFDFHADDARLADIPPRFNIAPTQPLLSIRVEEDQRVLRALRWGLVPGWVKDPKTFSLIINARRETVLEKASFRGAIRHRRCLIPATGYYEWDRKGVKSQPHYITRTDGEMTAFAAIWEEWSGPDGNLIETGALLTEPANEALSQIHHRMPVIVRPPQFDAWLDTRGWGAAHALDSLSPAQNDEYTYWAVSTDVNAVRNDRPDLIEPINSRVTSERDFANQVKQIGTNSDESAGAPQVEEDEGQLSLF